MPIAALAIVGALVLVPPSKAAHHNRIDYVGGLLSVVWIGSLVYMIIEGPHFGWGVKAVDRGRRGRASAWSSSSCGSCATRARSSTYARFAHRRFAGSNLAVALFFLAVFGAFYYLTQHLQFVLGYDALDTGVRMLPLAGAVFVGSALTGYLTPRIGMKFTVTAGMVGGTAALALLTRVDAASAYGDFVAAPRHPRPRHRARALALHGRDHGRVPRGRTGRRRRGQRHLAGARRLARHRDPRFGAGRFVLLAPRRRDRAAASSRRAP